MVYFPELDAIDLRIHRTLQKNARTTNKDLALKVGIAASTCLERTRRLIEGRVIRGFHADVDPRALGLGIQALISVRIRQHNRQMLDSFHTYVLRLPEVRGLFHITGADDFLVHVVASDSDALRDFALDALTTRPEVDHIQTRLIFEYTPTWRMPELG